MLIRYIVIFFAGIYVPSVLTYWIIPKLIGGLPHPVTASIAYLLYGLCYLTVGDYIGKTFPKRIWLHLVIFLLVALLFGPHPLPYFVIFMGVATMFGATCHRLLNVPQVLKVYRWAAVVLWLLSMGFVIAIIAARPVFQFTSPLTITGFAMCALAIYRIWALVWKRGRITDVSK